MQWRSPYRLGLAVASLAAAAVAGELHDRVRHGDLDAAARLIAAGADPEAEDEALLTPLVTAALAGQAKAVLLLIENGADPRGRDGNGFTALHAAAHAGHLGIVELLVGRGVDVDDRQNMAEITPLHAAAERGFRDIAGLLLRHGAEVEARSGTGHTPIYMAVLNGHAGTVALLRAHGGDCSGIRLDRYREFCLTAGD